ncbi:MAG: hypothetical protein LBU77_01050 [Clostridiales bacterium]|nr:hypothetical protein [Clostridiales bacterium]
MKGVIHIVVYISELRPDILDEVCGKLFMIVSKIRQTNLKKLIIGNAADFSHATRLVVDLSALKDTGDEIIEAVGAFKTMYPETRVIIIADREPAGSPLFARLLKLDVYNVLTSIDDAELKKCLTSGMTKEENKAPEVKEIPVETIPKESTPMEIMPIEKITANRNFKKHKPFVTVAVCSTEPHIGATHQALLMTKFLCGAGFKACYLEANERRNILYLARTYPVNANERKHLLQFESVDMYFDFKLAEVINAGYDFYIFDLGRFSEMEVASFLTKDIKIVVGGTKAWEMAAYSDVFEAIDGCRDVLFLMNHAPTDEKDGIRSLMGGYKTNFSEYSPYSFAVDVNQSIYKELFRDYLTIEQTVPAQKADKKKGFFGMRKE